MSIADFLNWPTESEVAEHEHERGVVHRDGVPWHKAPVPRRWHRCYAHSTYPIEQVERCACGNLRFMSGSGSGVWGGRNERNQRKGRRMLRPPPWGRRY